MAPTDPGHWLFAIALCIGACSQDDGARTATGRMRVPDSIFAESTNVAAVLDSTWLAESGPPWQVLSLPDSIRDFEMAHPTNIAIGRGDICVLSVTDYYENTVHFFTGPGRYVKSRFLGGHRRGALSGIGHSIIAPNGVTYVAELGRRRLIAIDSAGDSIRIFQSSATTATMPPIVNLQPVSRNRLLENWMAPSIPVASSAWGPESLPLVRIIDTLGNYISGLWRIADRPGHLLTHSLNQGILARQGDTLWFAYLVSGQIVRGVLDTQATPWALTDTARIILPRLFKPEPPVWLWDAADTIGDVGMDQQLTGFAVTEEGYLLMGQTISYPPRSSERLHVPSSAVVVYDGAGRPVKGWRMDGRIRRLSAGAGILAVIVDSHPADLEVRIYQLTDILPGTLRGPCSQEQ